MLVCVVFGCGLFRAGSFLGGWDWGGGFVLFDALVNGCLGLVIRGWQLTLPPFLTLVGDYRVVVISFGLGSSSFAHGQLLLLV